MPIDKNMYDENAIYRSWVDNQLKIIEPTDLNNNRGFRKPQRAALFAALCHLTSAPDRPATIVMPTGTGKTDAIFSLIIAGAFPRTLIIVPSDALRSQTSEKILELKNIRDFRAIDEQTLSPKVFTIKAALTKDDLLDIALSNVVISTPNALTLTHGDQLAQLVSLVSHLIVDEAHHVAAKTWRNIKTAFKGKPCIQFTATPFREDKQTLDGRIIYNYSLKDAQEDGYFQAIEFHPVREYQFSLSDLAIANKAVALLRADLESGKDHLLMARANSISKAKKIYDLYREHNDLSPVLVYSGVKEKDKIIERIKNRQHRIIVCVNMLGEGFDLPELKIAALHDQHCSPAVTLQFIGRLTRVNDLLGAAKFVANIANQKVDNQMAALYSESADWGIIIREVSEKKIGRELEREKFEAQFEDMEDGEKIIALNPTPNVSAVAYRVAQIDWKPFGAAEMRSKGEEVRLYSVNEDQTLVMAVTRAESSVSWANTAAISATDWHLYLAYCRKKDATLFISTSGDEGQSAVFKNLISTNSEKIAGEKTFRILHNINLLKFQNVGLTRGTRDIRFTMHVGRDINSVMDDLENGTAIKSNIFGIGFEEGSKTTAGCSYKGKLWEMNSETIDYWVKWCDSVSKKINNADIDTRDILNNVIRSEKIERIWPDGLFYADWPESIYIEVEHRVTLIANGVAYKLLDLRLGYPVRVTDRILRIPVLTRDELGAERAVGRVDITLEVDGYKIDCGDIKIIYGKERYFSEYLDDNPIKILKQDGSIILGNYRYYSPQTLNVKLPKALLSSWDWGETKINKESMGKDRDLDTVQGFTFSKIEGAYELIFNDDGAGEIADLVAINENNDHIQIDFYHCKYCSKDAKPGARVDDTYIVTGQASRSVKWLHTGEAIFRQLLDRYGTSLENGFDRILKGLPARLDLLRNKCRDLEVRIGFFIIQPAISEARITDEMLTVLGSSYMYLKNISGTELKVIVSR
ncbi:TPA: DEAD/DEAH box helicase family protein [Burkholderia vietnamiensis]|uniref:DEAD/DEAH box helicase n=1 Tax=Burkholderia vietnamiensis TaxID=60552 RepID=UPI0015949C43|nr:DEAD/DEAH box helicase family protein [Burkholderia vietnamiensis]MCA8212082.1 DEAD/DEAH box helicase family protein [Burkholderia vietnamiensis]HDR9122701.1 DEAD/DEAH box helicase family protein [Burkholderia vietnamiensis]